MTAEPKQNFINGSWSEAREGRTLPMINPSTGRSYGEIADSTSADVDSAVQAARAAYDTGSWDACRRSNEAAL